MFNMVIALRICPAQSFQVSAHLRALQQRRASSRAGESVLRMPYSNNSDPPVSPSFDNKLKNILQTTESPTSTLPPNVFQVSTKDECEEIVANKVDRLTVVRVYASWCRACKRVAPRFDRMAREHPDVNFVNIALTDTNKKFIEELGIGITSIPYGGIYHPEAGLVEQMKISANWFTDFEKIVVDYTEGVCALPETNNDGMYRAPYLRAI